MTLSSFQIYTNFSWMRPDRISEGRWYYRRIELNEPFNWSANEYG